VTATHRPLFRRAPLLAASALAALLACLPAASGPAPKAEAPGTATISAAQMRDYLTFIASDELEGRSTPSRGFDTAARFIATLLSRWGVKPGGDDGSYFQKIAMSAREPKPDGSMATLDGRKLVYGEDYFVRNSSSAGSASGPMVYAGDGWMIKSQDLDAFRGLDVKGKIVVVTLPAGRGFRRLQGQAGVDYADPATNAQAHGAAGLIFLAADNAPWAALRRQNDAVRYVVDRFVEGGAEGGVPTVTVRGTVAKALFSGEKAESSAIFAAAAAGMPLDGFELSTAKQVAFTTAVETVHAAGENVIGVVEGSDPVLKTEYVGVSGHLDHLGIADPPINGDRIYNGADDDGSGTTAVLAIAEALSHAPRRPKRSVALIWHMGEERGLLGSRYFTSYPTLPLKQFDAELNIDMIGRSRKDGDTNPANRELTGPNAIYVIGATMMSTELDALTRRVNANYLNLAYDYKYDDPKDPNQFFFRSDHVNYARQGIPILFFFDGVHEDYHRVTDEVSKIDFDKMQRVTRTIYQTLWEIASMHDRLKVDKPTPPQLRTR